MTIRLLQAMAGADHGGAEGFFERLAVALQRSGEIEQHALIRTNPRRAALLAQGGVATTQLSFGGMFDISTSWGFKRAIKAHRPQVVLTWMNRATGFCPKGDFVHVARLGGYYDLKYYRACDHLIGNTPHIRDWLIEQGWPAERAHYVPNFADDAKAEPLARAQFSTPPAAKLVVALGRLHENKAFDVLLKAAASVPDCYVWIGGEGPKRAELDSLASHLGVKPRVRFLGWRDDVAALLAAADLFVCPSRHEPLGNVVLEAWAQAVPVVAAAAQGPSQLITNGQDGLLVPVDDAPAMAASMRRLLEDCDSAREMGQAGRRAFEAQFTESAVVRAYMEFFAKVVP